MVTRVKEELAKPFWGGWTLKDFAVVAAVVSTLAVDHANIQRIMADVAAIRSELAAYRQDTTESITRLRMNQQRMEDTLGRIESPAINDKRVPKLDEGPSHPR